MEYSEWTSTDRAELKTFKEHPEEFVEKFFSGMEKLKSHSFIAENQHKVRPISVIYFLFIFLLFQSLKKMKAELEPGTVIIGGG